MLILAFMYANFRLSQVSPPTLFPLLKKINVSHTLLRSSHLHISNISQKHLYNPALYQISKFPPTSPVDGIILTGGLESAKAENRLSRILAQQYKSHDNFSLEPEHS